MSFSFREAFAYGMLQLENITYTYGAKTPFEKRAVDGVSLTFEDGKITGLIGHTGSGKSTLVQMLNGLIKPDSGHIYLDGRDIWSEPKKMRDVRFRVGLVMQYPEYQLFDETVRADISFGPKNMGLTEGEIAERVSEAARFAGVDESLLDKSPFDLSGGQKRRAAVAGVMAMRPSTLVLDEPAAGLDPAGRDSILSGIRGYCESTGATVIIVSHSMEDMAVWCDNVAVLADGKLCMTGTREEVFMRRDELVAVGLGVPMITDIAHALMRRGFTLGGDIYTVEGVAKSLSAAGGGRNA